MGKETESSTEICGVVHSSQMFYRHKEYYMKKIFPIISLILAVAGGFFLHVVLHPTIIKSVVNTDTTAIVQASIRNLECQLISADIEMIGTEIGLSQRQQREYVRYIDSAATKYKLPPILLHAIIYIESSYDPNARHSQIYVNKKSTFAIGLAGVVWEYHADSLKNAGIAVSRLELTEPQVNVMAAAYILHNYIVSILNTKSNLPESRLFDELIRKYYGAYDDYYKERMLTRIRDTASKQWIKRVTQDIFLEFRGNK